MFIVIYYIYVKDVLHNRILFSHWNMNEMNGNSSVYILMILEVEKKYKRLCKSVNFTYYFT